MEIYDHDGSDEVATNFAMTGSDDGIKHPRLLPNLFPNQNLHLDPDLMRYELVAQ